jgi:hypothetical protein
MHFLFQAHNPVHCAHRCVCNRPELEGSPCRPNSSSPCSHSPPQSAGPQLQA